MLLFWVSLMKGADQPDIIQEWRRLADRRFPKRWLGDLKVVALTFAELAKRKGVWLDHLEGWNVTKSTLLEQWTREAEEKAEAKAEAKVRREDLIRVLEKICPTSIPPSLRAKLNSEKNPRVLDAWFEKALESKSLAEFQAAAGM